MGLTAKELRIRCNTCRHFRAHHMYLGRDNSEYGRGRGKCAVFLDEESVELIRKSKSKNCVWLRESGKLKSGFCYCNAFVFPPENG